MDFCGRRRGLLRALTTEVEQFWSGCSPDRENLCLYGYADGSWEVCLPCEEVSPRRGDVRRRGQLVPTRASGPTPAQVPPELPEPALGINFAR